MKKIREWNLDTSRNLFNMINHHSIFKNKKLTEKLFKFDEIKLIDVDDFEFAMEMYDYETSYHR